MNMAQAVRTFWVSILWLFWHFHWGQAQHQHQTNTQYDKVPKISAFNDASVCKALTINYITHSLPQQCLTRWPNSAHNTERDMSITVAPNATTSLAMEAGITSTDGSSSQDATTTPTTEATLDQSKGASTESSRQATNRSSASEPASSPDTATVAEGDTQSDDLGSSFMSFEEWKAMMLRRTGQDPQDLKPRHPSRRSNDRAPPEMGQYSLGDEDEISLDFNNYLEKPDEVVTGNAQAGQHSALEERPAHDAAIRGDGTVSLHRSKDAGKTCKERFSYSSFDAGATILKAAPGTKNAKAILVENKDSYMLLECALQNKFVIVELSDDILIDTIVLANFEFFSSMIRHFQLSVSDRYPVKVDKWRELGTFEARNSRDIQAFLVENPQIWAKYIRIEFLTHYGNEFYCPVSLLRIHGSRMLDSWKDTETAREDDHESLVELDGGESANEEKLLPGVVGDHHNDPMYFMQNAEPLIQDIGIDGCLICTTSPASPLNILSDYCQEQCGFRSNTSEDPIHSMEDGNGSLDNQIRGKFEESGEAKRSQNGSKASSTNTAHSAATTPSTVPDPIERSVQHNMTSVNTTSSTTESGSSHSAVGKPQNPTPGVPKPRTGNNNQAPSASPMVQEGFFNAITKRLQHVESNLTLSLQYLENHSRYMQDTLRKAEQKQLTKATSFLNNLNHTVLLELRAFRDQYEQLWQSTIIALETQREESQRDTVALSARLNLLADEVVFQKRMAIVQAVLLLCCLFLVIFSRGVPIPYLAPFVDQNNSYGGYSAPNSPPRLSKGNYRMRPGKIAIRDHEFDREVCGPPLEVSESQPNHTNASTDDFSLRSSGDHRISHFNDNQTHQTRSGLLTPTMLDTCEETLEPESPPQVGDVHSAAPRQQSNLQSLQSRKPLPALPEHPSPH